MIISCFFLSFLAEHVKIDLASGKKKGQKHHRQYPLGYQEN
jgi:hypothetical protein